MYQYKASIVITVRDGEPGLREAVDSVVRQRIGMDKLQLILVVHGGVGESAAICEEYDARYDSVTVVSMAAADAAQARNEGLKHVQGAWVCFMDAQDTLSDNLVKDVMDFCDVHGEDTDVVACPIRFFGEQTGSGDLNEKFKKGTRVIHLNRESAFAQMHLGSAFIRTEAIKNHRFQDAPLYVQDVCAIQRILLEKGTLGVVKTAEYQYRYQATRDNSIFQGAAENAGWYLPAVETLRREVLEYAQTRCGYIPAFIQHAMMYDVQLRLKQTAFPLDVLNEEEKSAYLAALNQTLALIADREIMDMGKCTREYKFRACMTKYPEGPRLFRYDRDLVLAFPGGATFTISIP